MAATSSQLSKRASFTLVEIFIVFGLIAVLAAIVTIKPFAFLQDTRLKKCRDMILRNKDIALKAAKILHCGVEMKLELEDNALMVSIKPERGQSKETAILSRIKDRCENVGSIHLHTQHELPFSAPVTIVYHPNGECIESTTSDHVRNLEIITRDANGGQITIDLKAPVSPYVQDAPTINELYPASASPQDAPPLPQAPLPAG